MQEIVQYYGLRWYSVFLMYPLVILNRLIEATYPAFTLSALENKGVDGFLCDLFLKGTTLGLLFYFRPDFGHLAPAERVKRAISLGWCAWYILFS